MSLVCFYRYHSFWRPSRHRDGPPASICRVFTNHPDDSPNGRKESVSAEGSIPQTLITKSLESNIAGLNLRTRKVNSHDILELLGDEYALYAEQVGDPLLPAKIVYVSVPPGSKLENLSIKILQKKTLKQAFNIFPKQPETPTSSNVKLPFVGLRSDLAASTQPFPTLRYSSSKPLRFVATVCWFLESNPFNTSRPLGQSS